MAEKTSNTDIAKYKKQIRRDLETTIDTADVLSGSKDFDSKRLSNRRSKNDTANKSDSALKTRRFLDYIEKAYSKNKLVKIDLKREG